MNVNIQKRVALIYKDIVATSYYHKENDDALNSAYRTMRIA